MLRCTFFVVLVAGALPAGDAVACEAATLSPGVELLPSEWRRAAKDLVEASQSEGAPWGCTGGNIDLTVRAASPPDKSSGILTVTHSDGSSISREVAAPADVVPLGEALLAKPLKNPDPVIDAPPPNLPPPLPPPVVPPPGNSGKPPVSDAPSPSTRKLQLLLGVSLGPRYAGNSQVLWGGVTGSIGVNVASWIPMAWARYDGMALSVDGPAVAIQEICLGLSISRAFRAGPLEFRPGLRTALAWVSESPGKNLEEVTKLSPRVGVEVVGVVPVSSVVRARMSVDTELSPRELARPDDNDHATLIKDYPSYTMGVDLGVELALP